MTVVSWVKNFFSAVDLQVLHLLQFSQNWFFCLNPSKMSRLSMYHRHLFNLSTPFSTLCVYYITNGKYFSVITKLLLRPFAITSSAVVSLNNFQLFHDVKQLEIVQRCISCNSTKLQWQFGIDLWWGTRKHFLGQNVIVFHTRSRTRDATVIKLER